LQQARVSITDMRIRWAAGRFHPHEPARAEELRGIPLASFEARLAAYAIDFVIATLLYSPFYIAVDYLWQRRHGVPDGNIRIVVHFDFHEIWSLAFLALYFGLSLYWGKGQTIGKWMLRIRVRSLVSERITLWQAVERALGYGASALEGGFGFLQYFIHGNHCCVHDRIAETIVVKEPRRVKATVVVNATAPVETEEPRLEELAGTADTAVESTSGAGAESEENRGDSAPVVAAVMPKDLRGKLNES
jgi:uncharacterized RDD family membrane protein YckC